MIILSIENLILDLIKKLLLTIQSLNSMNIKHQKEEIEVEIKILIEMVVNVRKVKMICKIMRISNKLKMNTFIFKALII
jgi:hypothetical protein